MLEHLHEGHLDVTKCCALAQSCVWWPNLSTQIEDMAKKCHACAKLQPEIRKPLLPSSIPDRPWSRIGMGLFELKSKTYVIVVDYLSRWAEVHQLLNKRNAATITAVKSIFSTHRIPHLVI